MPFFLAVLACALIVSCGDTSSADIHTAERAPHAQEAGQCHADLALKEWTEHTGERRASLDFTLTLDGPGSVPVPYSVSAHGMPIVGLVSAYNAKDAGTGSGQLKLVAEEGWETLQAAKANQVRLGGIVKLSNSGGTPSAVSVAGKPCTLAVKNVAQFTPPPAQAKAPPAAAEEPTFSGVAPVQPGQTSEKDRATVREFIRKLMNDTRMIPATAAKPGGPRGSPGSYEKLTSAQVEEFITAIIRGAELFLPKSLTNEQRWALVCVEISAESAFNVATSGINPGDGRYVSVGPLQLTVSNTPGVPGMWEDIFRAHAKIPGLTHYDGSPWDPKDTSVEALKTSIYDGIIAALWCISEQGKKGAPDNIDGPDGPMPKVWRTSELCWVLGAPAARSGQDLAGQREAYQVTQETELRFLGFDPVIFDAPF